MICRVLIAVMAICLPVLAEEKVPVVPATAAAATAEPDTTVIDQFKKKKAAVVFTHKKHAHTYTVAGNLIKCEECHHKDEKGKEKKCGVAEGCHDGKKELTYKQAHGDKDKPKIKKDEKIDDYSQKGFYHANCLEDCHRSDKEKKAPIKCEGCHPKAAGEKEE